MYPPTSFCLAIFFVLKSRGTSLYFEETFKKEVPLGAEKDITHPNLP